MTPTSDQRDGGCQTELEIHDITSLEEELESFKIEMVRTGYRKSPKFSDTQKSAEEIRCIFDDI